MTSETGWRSSEPPVPDDWVTVDLSTRTLLHYDADNLGYPRVAARVVRSGSAASNGHRKALHMSHMPHSPANVVSAR